MSEAIDDFEALVDGSRAILGRILEPHEREAFRRYLSLLQRWQRVHRLVGSVEPRWVIENLFLDSLLFLRVMPPGVAAVVDVGGHGQELLARKRTHGVAQHGLLFGELEIHQQPFICLQSERRAFQ